MKYRSYHLLLAGIFSLLTTGAMAEKTSDKPYWQDVQVVSVIARGYAEVPAVTVDGIFGDATESSVSVIQSLLGLPTTGAIGPLTWEGMADLAENVLVGSQSARGQYPGYPVGKEGA